MEILTKLEAACIKINALFERLETTNIRAVKKPEPYKGKGIRYKDEHVRRKEGKTAAAKK